MNAQWQSIEKPPALAGYYIVGNPEVKRTMAARWMPNKKQWKFANAQQEFDVTHWQFLPLPPEPPK